MGLVIYDTCDVLLKRKRDGKVIMSHETQLASLQQTLGINEKIYAGIGNKAIFTIKGQKELTLTLRNALYDTEMLSATQGVEVTNGEVVIHKTEKELKVVDNGGTLEVTIKGNPLDNVAYVRNMHGEIEESTITGNVVTIPIGHANEGDIVSVTYQEKVNSESIIELDSEKFAEAYFVECRTVAYDTVKQKIVKEIYIQLDHVVPLDEFELAFENGSPIAPEMTLECLTAPNSTRIGRIFEVDVA